MGFVKKAYDIARKEVFFCNADDLLVNVARLMHSKNIGSVIVKKDDAIVGIITVNDMLRHLERNADSAKTKASQIMSSPLRVASKDLEVDELVDEFNKHKVSRMVLVDKDNKVVGVVRDIAVFKYLTFYKYDKEVQKRFARDYMHKLY